MGWHIFGFFGVRQFFWTVHSPLFFRKIVEIKRFALRAAILHECQNYLGGEGGLGGLAPSPYSYNPRRPPP